MAEASADIENPFRFEIWKVLLNPLGYRNTAAIIVAPEHAARRGEDTCVIIRRTGYVARDQFCMVRAGHAVVVDRLS